MNRKFTEMEIKMYMNIICSTLLIIKAMQINITLRYTSCQSKFDQTLGWGECVEINDLMHSY